MEVATAIVQNALDVGHLYKSNMALRHGLDRPERLVVNDLPPAAAQQEPAPTAPGPSPPVSLAPSSSPSSDAKSWWPLVLAGAGLVGGGTGLGAAVNYWLRSEPAAPTINVQGGEQGLLQYLQEQGLHLPPPDAKGGL